MIRLGQFALKLARNGWPSLYFIAAFLLPVSGAKHDAERAAATAEQKRNDDLQQAEVDRQNKIFDTLKTSLDPYLADKGQGFSPEQLAILKSQFLNSNSDQFNNAGRSVRSALVARGGGGGALPVGGDFVRSMSGLQGARASALSSGLSGIKMDDLRQALTNKFNSASVLSGNAASLNSPIGTFGAGASNALDSRVKLASIPGFGGYFANAFGGALGKGIGAALIPGGGSG